LQSGGSTAKKSSAVALGKRNTSGKLGVTAT